MPFVYPVHCTFCKANQPARYKIAARWSDGITEELKTYGLVCEDCLASVYRKSVVKQRACRLTPGETLEVPGIYLLERGHRDDQLHRVPELENSILALEKIQDVITEQNDNPVS